MELMRLVTERKAAPMKAFFLVFLNYKCVNGNTEPKLGLPDSRHLKGAAALGIAYSTFRQECHSKHF